MEQNFINMLLVCVASILMNIPMGYFRKNVKKFSFKWFFFIHFPVPILAMLKDYLNVELTWGFAPFYFGVYLLGQFIGKRYLPRLIEICKVRSQSGT